MKTTLFVDDEVMRRASQEAAGRGLTVSELVEAALVRLLDTPGSPSFAVPPLPAFDGGRLLVDVADREALYAALETV